MEHLRPLVQSSLTGDRAEAAAATQWHAQSNEAVRAQVCLCTCSPTGGAHPEAALGAAGDVGLSQAAQNPELDSGRTPNPYPLRR